MKKILSLFLAILMIASLGIYASAIPRTDTVKIQVGETRLESMLISEENISEEKIDGNIWYFHTTDESVLKVENYYVEENYLYINLKGISIGNNVSVIYKVYDEASSSWVDSECAMNGIYDVVKYLDLDTTTANILDNHKIEQNYTLTESEEANYTELSKVKLEWEVKDVAITSTANKTWDSENLKWVDGDDTFEVADTDVSFKLTNLGTKDVTAKVEFEQSKDLPEETAMLTEADFPITIGLVKSKAVSENADNTLTLAGDITVDETKFAEVTAESGLLGTYTVTIGKKFTITCNLLMAEGDENNPDYILPGQGATLVFYSQLGLPDDNNIEVTGATIDSWVRTDNDCTGTLVLSNATDDVVINVSACVLKGTDITMADGTTKKVENLKVGDMVLSYNAWEGKMTESKVITLKKGMSKAQKVITLTLDNGNFVSIVDYEKVFDVNKKGYSEVNEENYKEFVGKEIMVNENGKIGFAEIVSATMETKSCEFYTVETEKTNYIANNIVLTCGDEIYNILYNIGDDFKIDMDTYNEYVEEYGRYSYDDVKDYISEEAFNAYKLEDFKFLVGMGLSTDERILSFFAFFNEYYENNSI